MTPFTEEYVIERRNRWDLKTSFVLFVYFQGLLKPIAHDKKLSLVHFHSFGKTYSNSHLTYSESSIKEAQHAMAPLLGHNLANF